MKLAYFHNFGGKIWRMDLHDERRLFAFEIRDKDAGMPSFSIVSYADGDVLAEGITYGNRWWTLAGVTTDAVLLQRYPSPEQPRVQGLVALDFQGNILWEKFNIEFIEIQHNGIVVKPAFPLTGMVDILDETGEIREKSTPLSGLAPIKRCIQFPSPSGSFPLHFSALNSKAIEPVHRLELADREIWAFHEKIENHYSLRLLVFAGTELTFDEYLSNNLTAMLPETFFIIGRQLFFIRNNKQEIVSYFV